MLINKHIGHILVIMVAAIISTVVIAGCGSSGNSKEDARAKLGRMNIEYAPASFVKAIENKDDAVVKLFVEAGIELDCKDGKSVTPLMAAARVGNVKLMELIISQSKDTVNAVDFRGRSALFYAVDAKQFEAIEILDKAGIDWKIVERDGINILHCALSENNVELVKLILDHGIDVNQATTDGKTPLYLAQSVNNGEIEKLLLAKGAKLHAIYTDYRNIRYGYAAPYPVEFKKNKVMAGKEGISMTSPDGQAVLKIYGMNNKMKTKMQTMCYSIETDNEVKFTSKQQGEDWFSVTWTISGTNYYQKSFVGKGAINTVEFTYPQSQQAEYADLLGRLEKEFTPGNLNMMH